MKDISKNAFLKTTRMLSIFERLGKGELIVKSIEAERFGVNPKSIQRDLEDLRMYFYESNSDDIETEILYDHQRKGYYLKRTQHGQLIGQEAYALIKILLESRAFTKEEMGMLLEKLTVQCIPHERNAINDLIRNEWFHYIPLKHERDLVMILWEIAEAVRRQVLIEINYKRIGDNKKIKRTLAPLGIIFSEYYFYLVAYIHETDYEYPAIYRLDRILDYKLTRDNFYIPYEKRFQEGELRKKIQFMQSGSIMKLRLRFWGESLEAVLDRLPTAKIIEKNKEFAIIEAEVFGRGIKMWLLSQAQFLEVLKPDDFRREMRDTIKAMGEIYRE